VRNDLETRVGREECMVEIYSAGITRHRRNISMHFGYELAFAYFSRTWK